MKKLLGISLVAVLAATPLMASAADVAPSSSFTATTSGLEANGTNVITATKGAYYAGKTITDADKAATASAAYVKGAYNDAISAVNKVAADAATAATDAATGAIADLDATQTQTAGTDGLALEITQVDGVITSISGSIAADTYDAAGAATGVKNTIEGKLDDGADGYDIDANTLKIQGADVATQNYVTGAISDLDLANTYEAKGAAASAVAALGNVATQEGVENTIETATYSTSLDSGSTVTGYVPVMVNWGDSTANNSSAVALASGTVASASFSTTATSATYAEPVANSGSGTQGQ